MPEEDKNKVIHKELSYKIVGILFEVYNELGYGYKEKYYEKALMAALNEQEIKFETQVPFILKFKEKIIGRNYLDFLIEDRIVLEIKKGKHFSKNNLDQVKQYLKITKLKLAILANFTLDGIKYIRVLNA
jgi:GxxExxY protein